MFGTRRANYRTSSAQYSIKPVQAMAWVQIANFYLDDVAQGNPAEGYNGVKIGKTDALAKVEEAAKHVLSEYPEQSSGRGQGSPRPCGGRTGPRRLGWGKEGI